MQKFKKNMKIIRILLIVLFAGIIFTGCEPDDDWLKDCTVKKGGADIGGWDDGGTVDPNVDPGGGTPPGFDIRLEEWEDSLHTDLEV